MGLVDGILKQALGGGQAAGGVGGLLDLVTKNPQVVAAVSALLSSRDTSVGGSGGLAGLIQAFQGKGLGDVVSSWISKGPNLPVNASQVTDVLGSDTLGQFARKAGIPAAEAGSMLAGLLPTVIDKLTPDGTMPEAGALEKTLGSLLSGLKA